MANRWGKRKQWQTLFSWARKSLQMVTAATKLKRRLLLGRKAMTKQDSILKSRDITLLTKICIVQATLFPAVMYTCESWTIKKVKCQRIEAPKLGLPDAKSWLLEKKKKNPNAGKDWVPEENGAEENEMVGWHHQLNRQESEQTQGDMKGRESWCAIVHGVTKYRAWLSKWTTIGQSKQRKFCNLEVTSDWLDTVHLLSLTKWHFKLKKLGNKLLT